MQSESLPNKEANMNHLPSTPPVEWLHYPIIPRTGALAVFGDGGTGKSGIVASEIAAPFTVGAFAPITDYSRASKLHQKDNPPAFLSPIPPTLHSAPGTCLAGDLHWFSGDPHVTAHSDVERAGGDVNRLYAMSVDEFKELPDEPERYRGSAVVLDAPQGHFIAENDNSIMRGQIERYAKAAETGGFLLVFILHSGKRDRNDHHLLDLAHLRGASSIGQVLRSLIEVAVHPDTNQPWAGIVKSNIGPGSNESVWHYSKERADYKFISSYQAWPGPVGKIRNYSKDNDAADEVLMAAATRLWHRDPDAPAKQRENPVIGTNQQLQALCPQLTGRTYTEARTRCGFIVKPGPMGQLVYVGKGKS